LGWLADNLRIRETLPVDSGQGGRGFDRVEIEAATGEDRATGAAGAGSQVDHRGSFRQASGPLLDDGDSDARAGEMRDLVRG
jgi:hypothetical protein